MTRSLWKKALGADTTTMLGERLDVRGIDPKLTENFLLTQPDVLDASVWFSQGNLMAQVTVLDEVGLNARALQGACMEELGVHQTPRQIRLIAARPRAA